MRQFQIYGPYVVQCDHPRYIEVEDARNFWDYRSGGPNKSPWTLRRRKGVYVLAVRNRGLCPLYVGKATKSFAQEVLGKHQREQFNGALKKIKRGTPIVFLLAAVGRGSPVRAIDELETDLVRTAHRVNANLRNKHKRSRKSWAIHGVGTTTDVHPVGKGTGKSGPVRAFCRMMSEYT